MSFFTTEKFILGHAAILTSEKIIVLSIALFIGPSSSTGESFTYNLLQHSFLATTRWVESSMGLKISVLTPSA